jgi:NAD(P)-dependent dehydrogenase (short-subunit alcohol dehydrogenase family)
VAPCHGRQPHGFVSRLQACNPGDDRHGRRQHHLDGSQIGHVAYPGSSAYWTTKGALLQVAKGIALDYVGQGIRANTLSPGGIAIHRQLLRFPGTGTAQREWGARHPMGRLGEPDEMARAALFLASEESSFMTGTDLLIDGGYVAW